MSYEAIPKSGSASTVSSTSGSTSTTGNTTGSSALKHNIQAALPKTGDVESSNLGAVGLALLAALSIASATQRKRRRSNESHEA